MKVATFFEPISDDMPKVDESLRAVADIDYPILAEMLSHILMTGGKRLRPALTLLSGKVYDYEPSLHVRMATGIELLHTATLVHDDTVDNSLLRRGNETINSRWNVGTAVLVGDYLFARSAEEVARTGNLRAIHLFSKTLQIICKGELRQHFSAYEPRQSHQDYFHRIGSKTASLFATATESGAIIGNAPEESIQSLRDFGYNLGMAFQIVDDILDFMADEEVLGKPVGNDLLQGTVTLPALLLMEQFPFDNPVSKLLDNGYGDRAESVRLAVEMIRNSSVIEDSYNVAATYGEKARAAVSLLPKGKAMDSLLEICEYTIARKH